jgi:hypothetical protein
MPPVALTRCQTLNTHFNPYKMPDIIIEGARVKLTTPATPTSPVTNNTTNTFDWTNVSGYPNVSDYEYTVNGGTSFTTATAKPQTGLTGDYANGQVGLRVKAVPNFSTSSATLFNTTPFTSASADSDAIFTGGPITNTSQVYSPSDTNAGYGHFGYDATQKLAAGVTGRVYAKIEAADGQNYWLGFKATSGASNFYNTLVSFQLLGATYTVKTWDNATFGPTVGTADVGKYLGVWRNGSTGQIKIQISDDAVTWTDLATATSTSTGDLYANVDIDYNNAYSSKCYYPKLQGFTP